MSIFRIFDISMFRYLEIPICRTTAISFLLAKLRIIQHFGNLFVLVLLVGYLPLVEVVIPCFWGVAVGHGLQ